MLILVRHGRTRHNAAGLLLGRTDPPLDGVGRRQARAVARRLRAQVGADALVVSSPLLRARQTACELGCEVHVDERWIELDYGDFDATPVEGVGEHVWQRWQADPSYRPPRGESLADVAARAAEACESLAGDARRRDVIVVSHVSPIKAAVAWALGSGIASSWRSQLDPASICRVTFNETGPLLKGFNDVAHLEDPPRR